MKTIFGLGCGVDSFGWRLVATAFAALALWSCTDNAVAPDRAAGKEDRSGLPKLRIGIGSAPIARSGGALPPLPTALDLEPIVSALDPSGQAATSSGNQSAAAGSGPVTHLLLENNSTGARALWVISGGAIVNSANLGTMPISWRMVGGGDFNADGLEDVLWDNTGPGGDGSRAVWLMNGAGGVLSAVSLGVVPVEWHIAGAGDYDADGKDDILWENTLDGSRVLWLMNGGSVLRAVLIGSLSDWHMVAARDLNSDGKPDILLEHPTNGNKALWMMSGGAVVGSALLGALPLEWKLSGTSDIDGDLNNDILLENTSTGARVVWLQNGYGSVLSAPILTYLDPVWRMAVALVPDRSALAPNLTIDGMYLVQAVQTYAGTVPIVKDRDAYLRVFLKASRPNQITGQVRLRLYSNGSLTHTVTFAVPSSSVPTSIDQSNGSSSLNVIILGTSVQPGFALLADIDPSNTVAESNEADNQFPANGVPMPIDVRATPPLKIMLVPVLQSANGLQGDVTVQNAATFLDLARRLYPFASYNGLVRGVYTTSSPAVGPNSGWLQILNEVAALQVAEGYSDYNYYGVMRVSYASGILGMASLPGKAAIGADASGKDWFFAHELGHNWNRQHAPCGNPAGVDPNFPYSDGRIGVFGADVIGGLIKFPSNPDVMGYCTPVWVSDYTFRSILNYRATASQPIVTSAPLRAVFDAPAPISASPQALGSIRLSSATGTTASTIAGVDAPAIVSKPGLESCLILWGRSTPRGGLVLEPAFEAVTVPSMPLTAGSFTLAALGVGDENLLTLSFDPPPVADTDEGTKMFAYAVPTRMLNLGRVRTLRLSGAGRVVNMVPLQVDAQRAPQSAAITVAEGASGSELRWNEHIYPMLVVRDTRTGAILSLARGGRARVAARASSLEIRATDRIKTSLRLPIERR